MPSITLSGGLLSVGGTANAETIQVVRSSPGMVRVSISSTGETRQFKESSINEIQVRGGAGADLIAVGGAMTIKTDLRGGRGNDTFLGGGGDDTVHGSLGNDWIRGRNGNDDLLGEDGNDDIRGGTGDDSLDGGRGRDDCNGGSGTDDVLNGMDAETELTAILTGTGNGHAEFGFNADPTEIEGEFEVEAEDLSPGTTATVLVDGVSVGTMTINAFGEGKLKFKLDFDSNHDGVMEFPGNFPEIHSGSTISVQVNGSTTLSGTFA